LGPLRLRAGHAPRGPGEVVLDVSSAKQAGAAIGSEVRIQSTGPVHTFRVVGTMTFGDSTSAGPALASFDLGTAETLFGAPAQYDAINAAARPGVPATELQRRVALVLPPGIEAVTSVDAAQQDAQTVQNGLVLFEAIVLVFAAVGVFVGVFLIFNT